jgi:signal peptidase II
MEEKRSSTLNKPAPSGAPARRGSRILRLLYVLIAAAVFFSDQFTKSLVVKDIPDHAVIPVIPGFFNLLHTENSGMAFSLFSGASQWKMVLLVGVSVALLVAVVAVVWRSREIKWQSGVALALILGGALSNLADRIRFGQVVDFLDVYYRSYHWPTFNLADSAIVAGAGLLVLELLFSK